jgi:hypothetical protein
VGRKENKKFPFSCVQYKKWGTTELLLLECYKKDNYPQNMLKKIQKGTLLLKLEQHLALQL